MVDLLAAKRARMACRAYVMLYDAGPSGPPILKEDLMGPRDDPAADFAVAVEVIARFVDDTLLDEPGHRDGVPHYALTTGMRERMDAPTGGAGALVAALRTDLRASDAGEPVADLRFLRAEATVRTGRADAEPL